MISNVCVCVCVCVCACTCILCVCVCVRVCMYVYDAYGISYNLNLILAAPPLLPPPPPLIPPTSTPIPPTPHPGLDELVQPLDDLVTLDQPVHAVHVHSQLPKSPEDVLLEGLVAVPAHLDQGVQPLVVDKLQHQVFVVLATREGEGRE